MSPDCAHSRSDTDLIGHSPDRTQARSDVKLHNNRPHFALKAPGNIG